MDTPKTITVTEHNQELIPNWHNLLNDHKSKAICIIGLNDGKGFTLLSTDSIALHDLSNILLEASDSVQNQLRELNKKKKTD